MKLILHPDLVVLAFDPSSAHHMLSLMSVLSPSRRQMLARGLKSSCCSSSGSSGSSGGGGGSSSNNSSSSRSSSGSGSSSCSISLRR